MKTWDIINPLTIQISDGFFFFLHACLDKDLLFCDCGFFDKRDFFYVERV